jgi:hypothetical protein
MSRSLAGDPNWTASDLLERSRRLASLAAPGRGVDQALIATEVVSLQATCAQAVPPALPALRRGRRLHLIDAFDQLALAADDLAAVVELRCLRCDQVAVVPDLSGLVARIAERHDRAVGLLGRYGIRRTHMTL